jgi:hypothetical protein
MPLWRPLIASLDATQLLVYRLDEIGYRLAETGHTDDEVWLSSAGKYI